MKHGAFLKSVAVLSAGGFIAKALGALYRIPQGALLGGYGMGLYSMAYPFFCVLLTVSSAGIPSAFSRIVARETARGGDARAALFAALPVFGLLGGTGALAMCLLARSVAALQGDGALAPCYYALAPAVLFVALIAVFRGYFQGKNDMFPTAWSEICEQLVKVSLGLLFLFRYGEDPARAALYALLAVSLSEAAALACMILRFRAEPRRRLLSACPVMGGEILSAALPVMAASALLPLSQMADSIVVTRLLARHTARSVAQYGLFAGAAAGLVNLPATVSYGLVAALVPALSSGKRKEEGRALSLRALLFTLLLSAPCAAVLFFFARPVTALLYPSLAEGDAALLVRLLRLMAVSAALLACVDTLAACLTGMGRAKFAALSMTVALLTKLGVQLVLVPMPRVGILGAAIASDLCYLVAFLLDLVYTVGKAKKENTHVDTRGTRHKERRSFGTRAFGDEGGEDRPLDHRISARSRRFERGGDPL